MLKKRARIHPAIAVTAMVCLSAMAIAAEILGNSLGENMKIGSAAIIACLLGIKLRDKLPLT